MKTQQTLISMALFVSFVCASETDINSFNSSLDFAQVKNVKATQSKDGSWCFNVQVRHNDQGWSHYSDGWQVTDLAGNELGVRLLAHPHDTEQPFTRRQCNIAIPDELSKVVVSAKCNKHGFGGRSVEVNLTQPKGEGFSVKRN